MPDPKLIVTIDSTSPVPPFEQLRTQVASLVAAGELTPGTRLPTVRQLGLDLGLAANTVARSYRELESDGVIVTRGRRGTFVHSHALHESTPEALSQQALDLARAGRRAGLSLAETVQLVEHAWRGA